jgi:competence protein ComQ
MVMCSGQHQDLVGSSPTLEQYWRIAGAKSGEFFAIACHSGARLATNQADILRGFHQFGYNFGLLLQVLDDLKDYKDLSHRERIVDSRILSRSLPVVYVREVCANSVRDHFDQLLLRTASDPDAVGALTQIIEENGGTLYLWLSWINIATWLWLGGFARSHHPRALVTMLDSSIHLSDEQKYLNTRQALC